MKKSLILVSIIALLVMAGFAVIHLSSKTATPPGATESVVFDLQYRGLTAPDDGLSYRAFWGFGASAPMDVPFVEAVRKEVQEFDLVHNSALPDRQWSVVELKEKKSVALYFDLDGDGRLSENEKIPPTPSSKAQPEHEFSFITPDFMIRREGGRDIPFRVMLVADSYGGDRMNYMWSPCSILEGQASLAGKPTRLLLYGDGFSGSFSTFGACSFALVPAGQKLEGYLSRDPLSSLICRDGAFYRLTLDGVHEKDKTVRVTLARDTGPVGRVAASGKGTEALKARLTGVTIVGAEGDSVCFNLADTQSAIPVGRYRLSRGAIGYGIQSDDLWQVNFNNGPQFTIDADKTAQAELGTPALSVSAVDERERYNNDVREKSVYARGTPIYLTPRIRGKAGEVYLQFSQKSAGGNEWTSVKPHITILDADGKEIVSTDLEYG